MSKFSKIDYFLGGIISLGFILRFSLFWDWSLSNDELSAISRTNFDSLSKLISEGVFVDGHPAFTQVFLFYWIKIVGYTDWLIRLPFVISGCLAILYFYSFSKAAFNKSVATIATTVFVLAQPLILYSQIARPYSFGVLFTIGFAYYSYRLAKEGTKKWIFPFIAFGLFGCLTHYFAHLSIALLGVGFLLFCTKSTIKFYALSGVVILLSYLVHLPITLNHLSIGGVGWLAPPTDEFIWDYIQYVTYHFWPFQIAILCLPLIAVFLGVKIKIVKQLLLLLLFIIPYAIGYYYSTNKTPVLQFSVLSFALPFLILFLSSFFSESLKKNHLSLIIIALALTGGYGLFANGEVYGKRPFSNFKEIVQLSSQYKNQYKSDILGIANSNSIKYLDYYIVKNKIKPDFEISSIENPKDVAKARDLIASSETNLIMLSFANNEVPKEIHEFTKQKYPQVMHHHRFFNSEVIVYARDSKTRRRFFFHSVASKQNDSWSIDTTKLQDSVVFSKPTAFYANSEVEYLITYRDTVKNMMNQFNPYLTLSAHLKSNSPVDPKMVVSLDRDGENIAWRGFDIEHFYKKESWYQALGVFVKPENALPTDLITIYIWNNEKQHFFIDDFTIHNFEDSDYNYYE